MESILVTCSAKKEPGGTPDYVPSSQLKQCLSPQTYGRLMASRREITEKLLEYPEFENKEYISPGPDLGLDVSPQSTLYLPAFQRYTGRVFSTAEIKELYTPACRSSILIFSGLYGITEPEELIRDYNVKMSDTYADRKRIWRFWREVGLGDIATEYLQAAGSRISHDLLTNLYHQALTPWPRNIPECEIKQYTFPGRGNAAGFDRGEILKEFLQKKEEEPGGKNEPDRSGTSLSLFGDLLNEIDNFLDQVRIRLLIVDDHPPTRKRIAMVFQDIPQVEVVGTAHNGEEGIEKYNQLLPDVVNMDINMPGIDGITAAERIHNHFPEARIFIHSIQNEADYINRAEQAGVYDYLVAPASHEALINTVFEGARRKRCEYGKLLDSLTSFSKSLTAEKILPELGAAPWDESVREEARLLTRKLLKMLDTVRKAELICYLYSMKLIHGTDPYLFLNGADLSRIELPGGTLGECNLSGTILTDANLSGTHLERAQLTGVRAVRTKFDGACLQGGVLTNSLLEGASFQGAKLPGGDLRYIKCGMRRSPANFEGADLGGADLREADLRYAKFSGANLRGADLRGAEFSEDTFDGADLTGAIKR